jgi:tetratricopeptide (TPR) repeat protein
MSSPSGQWATADVKPMADDGGAHGPVGGSVRGVADEPAFANSGRIPPVPPSTTSDFSGGVPGMIFSEETSPVMPPRRGVGRWLALGSVAVIAIAGAVVYTTVLRGSSPSVAVVAEDAGVDGDGGPMDGDGGAVIAAMPDAAVGPSAAVIEALTALESDTATSLDAAIAGVRADPSPSALAAHARLLTAAAQALGDEATLTTDKKRAEQLRRDARQKLLDAVKPAQRALKEAADQALSHVAMADLLRLQGKPAADVRRHLDRARALDPADREQRLVAALLDLREGKTAEARSGLDALDRGAGSLEQSGDVRPRFQRALLAQAAGDAAAARAAADAVLAVASNHAGARALVARLGDGTADPLPPEDTAAAAPTPTPTPSPTAPATAPSTPSAPAGDGDSYDRALAQANKLAEVDCGRAMPLFERAIDLRPNGVEALTGAGYCHIDNKEFASAHAKFRAALAVSRRFERALWGIAEAYQQQGRSDLAADAYRAYLEVYPDSAQAKRQLDKLSPGSSSPPAPAPTPAPAEPPAGGGTAEPAPPPAGE